MEVPIKKTKKITKKKADTIGSSNRETNNLNLKSIKIPERIDEKEKLLISLKSNIGDIDLKIKNLKSKKEYYLEIVSVLEKELNEVRERQIQLNKNNSNISVIQEELYSKFLLNFYSYIEMKIISKIHP